jgi:hypothetical protein
MGKYTVYGELCLDEFGTEWDTEVELGDEQARNLRKLIMWHGGDTDVKYIELEDAFPDIYDILNKACYKATLDAYNEHLRSCGKPEVDKLDFEHNINIPYEFQDIF